MLATLDTAERAFIRRGEAPRPTFALALVSVTVAVLAMHLDAVTRYSEDAFFAGALGALVLSIALGKIIAILPTASGRVFGTLFLSTAFGAFLGMIVQAIVAYDLRNFMPVYDLEGTVDTAHPVSWVLSGIVLGGVPALLVAGFLLLAGRAVRRFTGHDASERFGVGFIGAAGLLASFSLVLVDRLEAGPLVLVALVAWISVLASLLIDGSRIRFLRRVFRREDPSYEIVPASFFAGSAGLAPIVAQAGADSVLVRVDVRGSYRLTAATPIAYLADTEEETIAPLRRRRVAATAVLGAITLVGVLASLVHAG